MEEHSILAESQKQNNSGSYWDPRWQRNVVKVMPGEIYTSSEDIVITTVLGSCVSACLYDPYLKMGAMNHFMLPTLNKAETEVSRLARFGSYAMEKVINELLKLGCEKSRLQVKVTGGGNMLGAGADIGVKNTQFVLDYLLAEGLQIISADLGGTRARRVAFFPTEGRLLVRKLENQRSRDLESMERRYLIEVNKQLDDSDVELF